MKKEILSRALQYIDSWLAFRAPRVDIPGWAVAITHQNKVVFNKAYGYAQLDTKEEMTTDHLFRVASHSKSFAAVSILQLEEEGKLTLDDSIVKHLPWLKSHSDSRLQVVTIRQLLSHSSGMTRDSDDCDFWEVNKPFPTKKELKKIVLDTNLAGDTNVEMKYSNIAYGVVGMIIESVTGLSFDEYIQKHICKPLGLKNTGGRLHEEILDRLTTGYSRRDTGQRLPISKKVDTASLNAATGCYSTTAELNSFYSALAVGSNQLLNDESKKIMQQALWNARFYNEFREYGLGLQIEHFNERRVYGHGGGFPGQITSTCYDPKEELGIAVFSNAIDAEPRTINKGIWSVLDFFAVNHAKKPSVDATHFEGRYMCLWSLVDIVAWGNRIVSVNPDNWFPLNDPEELEYVDDQTLKVIKTDGYSALHQLLKFEFDKKGAVKSINYTGVTMLPEKKYLKSLQG
jgi:D-alanyl-D-alanine carboxypeptidase